MYRNDRLHYIILGKYHPTPGTRENYGSRENWGKKEEEKVFGKKVKRKTYRKISQLYRNSSLLKIG